MLSTIFLAILIIVAALRMWRPGGQRLAGQVIHDAQVPLLARLRQHAVPAAFILLAALASAIWWDLPAWGPLAALLALAALIVLPARYTLTTLGIRDGWLPFRRWTEFAGVSQAPGGVRLIGVTGVRDLRLWLSGSRGDDEFVALLRRMIKGAYKGQNVRLDYPAAAPAEAPGQQAAATEVSRTLI